MLDGFSGYIEFFSHVLFRFFTFIHVIGVIDYTKYSSPSQSCPYDCRIIIDPIYHRIELHTAGLDSCITLASKPKS